MSEPTYADVAKWLPTDVREAIEATTPCPVRGQHVWLHNRTLIHAADQVEPVLVYESWNCDCGLVHTTDPEAHT